MSKRVLALLGSPHKNGKTGKMLNHAVEIAEKKGYHIDYIHLYEKHIAYCSGCRTCLETQKCVQNDDLQEIVSLLKSCDIVILAAPTYWANVPAVVKNLFDRLLGVAMEETNTFPKPRLSNKQHYILLTACNTAAPFCSIFGQSSGSIRCMKEFFKTSGMRFGGKCVWAGPRQKELPCSIKRKLKAYLS